MVNSIGEFLDALGLKVELDEGELISGAIVLMETIESDGTIGMQVVEDDSLSWIKKVGMLKIAMDIASREYGGTFHPDNED